jgi:transposase
MQSVTTIALDIAKSVFQVHGADAHGNVVVRRQLKRRQVVAFFEKLPPCLVGMEACASSHHWSREHYLRSLFTAGALAVIPYAKIHGTRHRPWLTALLARRPTKVVAIALANKLARITWAMMARGAHYKEPAALAT